MGVYISESSLSFYSSVLHYGVMSNILLISVGNLLLLFVIYYYVLGKYFNKEVSGSVLFLKTEKDFSRCTFCISIMCLVYIAVILSLNCIFVFLSTAVQVVPDTELKHCEDIFNLASGDTSHKSLHQVAMEQKLFCIDINITDGLQNVVLAIILSVSVTTLFCLVLLKYTEEKDIIPFFFKLPFIAIYICICIVVPVVACINFLN